MKGLNGRCAVSVRSNETIKNLIYKIERKGKMKITAEHLVFRGKVLHNDKTLKDYGIGDEDTLHLSGRGRGKPHDIFNTDPNSSEFARLFEKIEWKGTPRKDKRFCSDKSKYKRLEQILTQKTTSIARIRDKDHFIELLSDEDDAEFCETTFYKANKKWVDKNLSDTPNGGNCACGCTIL